MHNSNMISDSLAEMFFRLLHCKVTTPLFITTLSKVQPIPMNREVMLASLKAINFHVIVYLKFFYMGDLSLSPLLVNSFSYSYQFGLMDIYFIRVIIQYYFIWYLDCSTFFYFENSLLSTTIKGLSF